jgi:PAS domain-containing protein
MHDGGDRYVVLATTPDSAVYFCNSLGVITDYNNRAAELWGRRPALDATDERFCGSHRLYRADGSYLPHDQCPMADVLAGRVPGIYDAEVQIQRPDGSRVVVMVNVAPLIDDDSAIVGAVNSFRENRMGAK